MITTGKAFQKELSQYIRLFQGVIEIQLDKMGLEVIVKHNKKDPDDMFDVINDRLIQVCDEYLKTNNLGVDKFGLATIVMQLYTQAASECEEPYKVIVKETKGLLQDYLDKNKQKREALKRVKEENKLLDEQNKELEISNEEKKKMFENLKAQQETLSEAETVEEETSAENAQVEEEEIVFPKKRGRKKKEVEPLAVEEPPKPKKKRGVKSVYETAVDFTF